MKLNANIILGQRGTERALTGKEGKQEQKRDTVTKSGPREVPIKSAACVRKKMSVRTEEA